MSARGKRRKGKPPSSGAVGRSTGAIRPEKETNQDGQGESSQDPAASAAAFERELFWCIQTLERGLTSVQHKPDRRQVEDALKALKILQNPKAHMVKKRQVMRNTFGDYRQKMAEEERKHTQSIKKLKLEPVIKPGSSKSYLKKAQCKTNQGHELLEGKGDDRSMSSIMSSLQIHSGDGGFKFNFDANKSQDETTDCTKDTVENVSADKVLSKDGNTEASAGGVPIPVAVNYYKMEVGNETFSFGFKQQETNSK